MVYKQYLVSSLDGEGESGDVTAVLKRSLEVEFNDSFTLCIDVLSQLSKPSSMQLHERPNGWLPW